MGTEILQKINNVENALIELKRSLSVQMSQRSTAHFADLLQLINSPDWPSAVDPDLLCDDKNESEKIERAEGIRDIFIDESVNDKNVLDFGCGDGHLINAIIDHNPKQVIGYDYILCPKTKPKKSIGIFTQDKDVVKEKGPYDIIVLYDVLDHLEDTTMLDCLRFLRQILHIDGKIYIRAHPFIARHGGHAYTQINKAFVHLFLLESELKYFCPNLKNYPTQKVIYPVKTYKDQIDQSGLNVANVKVINSDIEDFFKTPEVSNRITDAIGVRSPIMQMQMQFVDFVLTQKK